MLLLFTFTQAQDTAFLNRLKTPMSIDDAQEIAKEFAASTTTQYRFYKAKEFKEENRFLIVYAPDGITDEQIVAQKHNENCLALYFRPYKDGYVFDKAVVNYDDIFRIWTRYFKPNSVKDKKSAGISVSDEYYSLSERSPNWVIRN